MRASRKILLILLLVLGVPLVALVVAFLILSRDAPPPDDADLRFEVLWIPDEENAFTHYRQAFAALRWPRHREARSDGTDPVKPGSRESRLGARTAGRAELADAMANGEEWDEALAREILENNADTFAFVKAGLSCRECQVPAVDDAVDDAPYLGPLGTLGQLVELRIRHLERQDRHAEALTSAMELVRLGHHFQKAKAPLVIYLVGSDLQDSGLDRAQESLPHAGLASQALRSLAAELSVYTDDGKNVAHALRAEYMEYCATIDRPAPDVYKVSWLSKLVVHDFCF